MKVLVVDDHDAVLGGLARLIEAEGPRLQVAGLARTGAEALRLAREACPDVVVLDLLLDGECGLDLLPALKQACGAEVVVLTSVSDARARDTARLRGACAYVSKLAPAAELIAAIDAARPAPCADKHVGQMSRRAPAEVPRD